MNKTVFALFLAAIFFFPVAYANDDSVTEMCKQEAISNEVSGEEMEAYVQACVEDMNMRMNTGSEQMDSAAGEKAE